MTDVAFVYFNEAFEANNEWLRGHIGNLLETAGAHYAKELHRELGALAVIDDPDFFQDLEMDWFVQKAFDIRDVTIWKYDQS